MMEQHSLSSVVIREALTFSGAPVIITDPNISNNPIVFVNEAFEELTGYTAEEAVGQNCRFLQREDTDKEALRAISEAVRLKLPTKQILKNYKKNGDVFYNELTIRPIYDENGAVYFLGLQKDVSEVEQLKREMRHAEETIFSLTAPIIPLSQEMAILPLIGILDENRFKILLEKSTRYLEEREIAYLILDFSGLTKFDESIVTGIMNFRKFLDLMGIRTVFTGINPPLAKSSVLFDNHLQGITTFHSVDQALKHFQFKPH